ncbi:MAG: T9SS type A sorting domain-containing protein [Flavobacteriales bacterium]
MRLSITAAIAVMPIVAFSQITLEHTYPNAGYYASQGQLMMVDLEASGMSYVEVDRANKEIKLYHLDHSLFKTVSYANVPLPANPITTVYLMYISEHLFDQDDGLEFMYLDPTPGTYLTQVYNEDGSLLLDEPGSQPLVLATVHNQQYPIYNTDQGTKLILSHTDGTARVYSLGGTLTTAIAESATGTLQAFASASLAFPNPTGSFVQFALASTLQRDGELTITDAAGRVIRSVNIARGTSQISQDVSDLPDGAYLYRLTSGGSPLTSGTFIRAQ